MRNVLLSICPKWCEKILSGEKTIEVRKSAPKEVPFKCYIYCTIGRTPNVLLKDKNNRFVFGDYRNACTCDADGNVDFEIAQGKVIGEFICDKVYNIINSLGGIVFADENLNQLEPQLFRDMSCLTDEQTTGYLGNKDGYGWNISDLKIYDKPRELSEFRKPCSNEDTLCHLCDKSGYNSYMQLCCFNTVTRPPQSWCYVEEAK